jgi:hypothetical protein
LVQFIIIIIIIIIIILGLHYPRKIIASLVAQLRENIVKWIKGQRISWLGHLERIEENRMPKMIFSQELEGRDEGEDPGKDGKKR